MRMSNEWRVRLPFRFLAGFIALCGAVGLAYTIATSISSGAFALSLGGIVTFLGVLWFTPPLAWIALRGTRPRWPGF
jgi:hypothetical protein